MVYEMADVIDNWEVVTKKSGLEWLYLSDINRLFTQPVDYDDAKYFIPDGFRIPTVGEIRHGVEDGNIRFNNVYDYERGYWSSNLYMMEEEMRLVVRVLVVGNVTYACEEYRTNYAIYCRGTMNG